MSLLLRGINHFRFNMYCCFYRRFDFLSSIVLPPVSERWCAILVLPVGSNSFLCILRATSKTSYIYTIWQCINCGDSVPFILTTYMYLQETCGIESIPLLTNGLCSGYTIIVSMDILYHSSSPSVHLSLIPGVRFVASTVMDGFFPYLAQMITSMQGCVVLCHWFWPWQGRFNMNMLKSGTSFRVSSAASTLLQLLVKMFLKSFATDVYLTPILRYILRQVDQ